MMSLQLRYASFDIASLISKISQLASFLLNLFALAIFQANKLQAAAITIRIIHQILESISKKIIGPNVANSITQSVALPAILITECDWWSPIWLINEQVELNTQLILVNIRTLAATVVREQWIKRVPTLRILMPWNQTTVDVGYVVIVAKVIVSVSWSHPEVRRQ